MKALTSIVFVSLTSCAIDPTYDGGGGGGGDDDDDGGEVVSADGTYRVHSQYDVTVEALLPQPAADVVVTMRDFSTDPAHTLLDLCEAVGVPAVATLRSVLPSALETKLEGWIDDQINKVTVNGQPLTQVAGELAALAETALTQFAVDSELVIAGDRATHRLTALDFTPAGAALVIDLGDLPAELTVKTTTAQVHGAQLTVGDHGYSLAYGQYAWRAIEAAVEAEFGAKPRALLGAAVNCPAVAAAVANKCVLSVCVGHRAELTEVCERGLDEVVGVAQRKIEAIRFDAIHLGGGTATVAGTRLEAGTWTAEINAGQGLRHVPATFTGAR